MLCNLEFKEGKLIGIDEHGHKKEMAKDVSEKLTINEYPAAKYDDPALKVLRALTPNEFINVTDIVRSTGLPQTDVERILSHLKRVHLCEYGMYAKKVVYNYVKE